MDTRNTVDITINGRRYKLSGSESPAYMQKAADYINTMYEKLKAVPGFTGRSHDYQTMMMYLNLADEYLKKSGWTEEKQAAADTKAAEDIYRLKLELVEARKQAEAAEASRSEETFSLKKQLEVAQEEKKRLADRDRESLSKINGLEKDVDNYKTEISILKRKVADYVKNSAQVEKQLKDAAAREREEKLLRNQYESQLSKQKADYEARLSQLQQDLPRERAAQEEKMESMRKQLAAQKAENENRAAEMQKQAAALKAGYEVKLEAFQKQIDQQAEDYENQMAELRAEYENRISSMKPGYENLLTEQENEYEARISELKESYETRLEELEKQSRAQLEELEKQNEARKNDDLNKEALKEQLESQKTSYEKKIEELQQSSGLEKAALFQENGELMKEKRQLQQKIRELTEKINDSENDMIEYLDLIDEKDKEIASLKFKLQEAHYE